MNEAFSRLIVRTIAVILPVFLSAGCALVDVPGSSTAKVPTASPPLDRYEGLNEKRDPVTRVKLGRDVLVPQPLKEDVLPDVVVGPYELRGETLASALQMILDDYDVSLAFESNEGLTRRITVSNLHGKLKDVVNRVCSLADLYCHFEAGNLTIKKTETFVVDLPPLGGGSTGSSTNSSTTTSGTPTPAAATSTTTSGASTSSTAYAQIAAGLAAVIGSTPTVDETTRVMIYTATQRSHKYAMQYFERLRKNTALIIFETNIWEVTLTNENRTGIDWSGLFNHAGNFSFNLLLPGGAPSGIGTPMSITPDYTNGSGSVSSKAVLEFISARGAVKTISQPQITVLSGSKASFSVSQNENFVSGLTRTPPVPPAVTDTISVTTGTVNTGLTMSVTSAWDQSTVYGDLNIQLDDLLKLTNFTTTGGNIQLPQTTKRSLQTQIRVRPGDAILIGGLVSEKDNLNDSGPGFMKPLFATTRGVSKTNTELVFLLRPRVVAFDMGNDSDTPAMADAPREGAAVKALPVPDISDAVKDIFGGSEPPADVAPVLPDPPVITTATAPIRLKEPPEKKSKTPETGRGGLNQ